MKTSNGATMAIDEDVVDREIDRVFAVRPLELVGIALQRLRPVQMVPTCRRSLRPAGRRRHAPATGSHPGPCPSFRTRSAPSRSPRWAVGRTAFAAGFPGLQIDIFESVETMSSGQLIVLEIDESTHFCAAACIRTWSSGASGQGVDKMSGRSASPNWSRHICTAYRRLLLLCASRLFADLARVGIGKDRFDPDANIARIKAKSSPSARPGCSNALRISCSRIASRTSSSTFLWWWCRGIVGRRAGPLPPVCMNCTYGAPSAAVGVWRAAVRIHSRAKHQQSISQPGDAQPILALACASAACAAAEI